MLENSTIKNLRINQIKFEYEINQPGKLKTKQSTQKQKD